MTRRAKWFWVFVGVALLIGFLALIPFNGEICEKADNAGHKECATHGLPVYIAFKVQAFLDFLGVAITAIATIAIAIFTFTLKRSTDRLWKAGDDQLKLAAETAATQSRETQESIAVTRISAESSVVAAHAASQSAHVAEQTLLAAERPYVLLEVVNTDNLGFALRTYPSMTIKFVNHGNSPALMKICFIELLDDPPANPGVAVSKLPIIYHVIAAGGAMDPIEVPVANVEPNQVWTGDNAKRLVLHGYLKYGDILEAMHTQHIYLRAGKDFTTWTEEGGTSYNYRHTQLPYEVEIKVQ